MTNITNIPLHQLTAWQGNVRKVQNKGFIDELAASIKAHGLQQNLVVKRDGRKFAVVAGGQRLKALQQLVKSGDIKANYRVPCKVVEDDAELTEVSLVENVVRDNMHPADQFEAFSKLVDGGMSMADVAARFGITDRLVAQRLKLARVSPAILEAYRKGDLKLESVMAFAVSDDHETQERVRKDMPPWYRPSDIRSALTVNDIAATDKRVKFVTLKAYEAAGGTTRRDLFSDDDAGFFILDAVLLDKLALDKLERSAKPIRKEGWKWVEVRTDFGYDARGEFHRRHAELVPLPPKEAARLDILRCEHEVLLESFQEADDETERPARLDELEEAIDKLQERDEFWPEETLAIAGAVVSIGHDGKSVIERGLVRPEDMPKKTPSAKSVNDDAVGGNTSPGISAALIDTLTAQKSVALSAELLLRPDIALVAVVHSLASSLGLAGERRETCLNLSAQSVYLKKADESAAHAAMESEFEGWSNEIPDAPDDLWKWCLEQEQSLLLELLAFIAAIGIDAVRTKTDRTNSPRLLHADQLASALGLDMKKCFTPTAENYFSRISKTQILEALREARGTPTPPAWEKLKKPELAALAEREIAGTGWLPPVLR